jgi:heme/copper-type cytochrome/quinol oxidase subunit 2
MAWPIPELGVGIAEIKPEQVNIIEFTPSRVGVVPFLCTAWCSDEPRAMNGKLIVLDAALARPEPSRFRARR